MRRAVRTESSENKERNRSIAAEIEDKVLNCELLQQVSGLSTSYLEEPLSVLPAETQAFATQYSRKATPSSASSNSNAPSAAGPGTSLILTTGTYLQPVHEREREVLSEYQRRLAQTTASAPRIANSSTQSSSSRVNSSFHQKSVSSDVNSNRGECVCDERVPRRVSVYDVAEDDEGDSACCERALCADGLRHAWRVSCAMEDEYTLSNETIRACLTQQRGSHAPTDTHNSVREKEKVSESGVLCDVCGRRRERVSVWREPSLTEALQWWGLRESEDLVREIVVRRETRLQREQDREREKEKGRARVERVREELAAREREREKNKSLALSQAQTPTQPLTHALTSTQPQASTQAHAQQTHAPTHKQTHTKREPHKTQHPHTQAHAHTHAPFPPPPVPPSRAGTHTLPQTSQPQVLPHTFPPHMYAPHTLPHTQYLSVPYTALGAHTQFAQPPRTQLRQSASSQQHTHTQPYHTQSHTKPHTQSSHTHTHTHAKREKGRERERSRSRSHDNEYDSRDRHTHRDRDRDDSRGRHSHRERKREREKEKRYDSRGRR